MSDNDMGLTEAWAKIATKNEEEETKMNEKNAAIMRSWANIALKNEGYDPRRDAVARFILNNVGDPYEKAETGSTWIVNFEGEERVAVRGETRWYLCETDDSLSEVSEVVELVSELVPKSTPDHPTVLTTEEDYQDAPEGTIVADNSCFPRVKDRLGFWVGCGAGRAENSTEAALHARRVLRWGWGA